MEWRCRSLTGDYCPRQFEFHPYADNHILFGTMTGEICSVNSESGNISSLGNYGLSSLDTILGICWLKDRTSNRFLVGSSKGRVTCGDFNSILSSSERNETSTIVKDFEAFQRLTSIHANSDSRLMLLSGYHTDALVYDIETGSILHNYKGIHSNHINISRFTGNSPSIFSTSSFDGTIKTWDLRNSKQVPLYTVKLTNGVVMINFSNDDHFLLASGIDNEISQFFFCDGRKHLTYDVPKTGLKSNYCRTYYTASGRHALTGSCEEHEVKLMCAYTGHVVANIDIYPGKRDNSLYVQSLRGSPTHDSKMCVLSNYRDSSHRELVEVVLSRCTKDAIEPTSHYSKVDSSPLKPFKSFNIDPMVYVNDTDPIEPNSTFSNFADKIGNQIMLNEVNKMIHMFTSDNSEHNDQLPKEFVHQIIINNEIWRIISILNSGLCEIILQFIELSILLKLPNLEETKQFRIENSINVISRIEYFIRKNNDGIIETFAPYEELFLHKNHQSTSLPTAANNSIVLAKFISHSACPIYNDSFLIIGGGNRDYLHGFRRMLSFNTISNQFSYLNCSDYCGKYLPMTANMNCAVSLQPNNVRHILMFGGRVKTGKEKSLYSALKLSSLSGCINNDDYSIENDENLIEKLIQECLNDNNLTNYDQNNNEENVDNLMKKDNSEITDGIDQDENEPGGVPIWYGDKNNKTNNFSSGFKFPFLIHNDNNINEDNNNEDDENNKRIIDFNKNDIDSNNSNNGIIFELDCLNMIWTSPVLKCDPLSPKTNYDYNRNLNQASTSNGTGKSSNHFKNISHPNLIAIDNRVGQTVSALYQIDIPYRCETCLFTRKKERYDSVNENINNKNIIRKNNDLFNNNMNNKSYSDNNNAKKDLHCFGECDCSQIIQSSLKVYTCYNTFDNTYKSHKKSKLTDVTWLFQFGGYCLRRGMVMNDLYIIICTPQIISNPSNNPIDNDFDKKELNIKNNLQNEEFSNNNDVNILYSYEVIRPKVTGNYPSRRFSHCSVIIPSLKSHQNNTNKNDIFSVTDHSRMIIFGGITHGNIIGDLASLRLNYHYNHLSNNNVACFDSDCHWEQVIVDGNQSPGPRHGHTMTYDPNHNYVILFGGITLSAVDNEEIAMNDVWKLMLVRVTPVSNDGFILTVRWEKIICDGIPPAVRSRHTFTYMNGYGYVFGGIEDIRHDGGDSDQEEIMIYAKQRDSIVYVFDIRKNRNITSTGVISGSDTGVWTTPAPLTLIWRRSFPRCTVPLCSLHVDFLLLIKQFFQEYFNNNNNNNNNSNNNNIMKEESDDNDITNASEEMLRLGRVQSLINDYHPNYDNNSYDNAIVPVNDNDGSVIVELFDNNNSNNNVSTENNNIQLSMYASLLMNRCDFFKVILNSSMAESRDKRISLVDISQSIFACIMLFLHCDIILLPELPIVSLCQPLAMRRNNSNNNNNNENENQVKAIAEIANMLDVAKRYGIITLTARCEGLLIRFVSIENVFQFIELSDWFDMKLLKHISIQSVLARHMTPALLEFMRIHMNDYNNTDTNNEDVVNDNNNNNNNNIEDGKVDDESTFYESIITEAYIKLPIALKIEIVELFSCDENYSNVSENNENNKSKSAYEMNLRSN
eukprot:gene5372-7450_t